MTSARKGWTTLRKSLVYETPWISVHDHDVVAPTGKPGVYGTVHMKNYAVGVLPIDENGFTWLVGQSRFVFDAWSWELPEGGGARDEMPVDAARRELAEETSLQAATFLPLFENIEFSNSVTDEIGFAFLACDLSPCAGRPDETEDLELRHLPVKDVFEMIDRGEITDMFTLAMLSRAYHLANTGRLPDAVAKVFR